jgi:hypothetical protein
MAIEANRSARTLRAASAMATPPMPKPATSAVHVKAEIAKDEKERDGPNGDTQEEADDGEGVAGGRCPGALASKAPFRGQGQKLIGP